MYLCPIKAPARCSQSFGKNPQIYKQFGLIGHNGIDYVPATRSKAPTIVYAPIDGIIYEVGDQGTKGYGKYLRIRTAPDRSGIVRECVLGHFSRIFVQKGEQTYFGNELGIMGNTGFSTGPHVHMGIRKLKGGKVLDANNGYAGYIDTEPYMLAWKN